VEERFEKKLGTMIRLDAESIQGICPDGLVEKDCPIFLASQAVRPIYFEGYIWAFGSLDDVSTNTEGLLISATADLHNDY